VRGNYLRIIYKLL